MKLQLYFPFLFSLLFIESAVAQTNNFSFNRLSTLQGLSQGHVNDILKDANGFMWFATDGGLNKYDGYNFTVYKNSITNTASIGNNAVLKIKEEKPGVLWAATGSCLDRFDMRKETFQHYRPGKDIIINDLLLEENGSIWLGTTEGLFLFDKIKNSFKKYDYQPGKSNCLSNNHIYSIRQDKKGLLWIATKDGLNRFDPHTQQFTVFKKEAFNPGGLQTNWIRSLYRDSQGGIWIGTIGSGIYKYIETANSFIHYKNNPADGNSLARNDVLSFAEDQFNNLWIGTENGGISILNPQTNHFTNIANDATNEQSLSNNSIYALYKDNAGNMWAGTWSGGANFLAAKGKKFQRCKQVPGNLNSLNNHYILSIFADKEKNIWIGTDGGGLNRFNMITGNYTHYTSNPALTGAVKNDYIISLSDIGNGLLALGNHRGGIDIFNTKAGRVVRHLNMVNDEDPKFQLSVNTLYKDRLGNLWAGTWGGGIYVFDPLLNLKTRYSHSVTNSNSINSDFINCFLQTSGGDMWIGTDNGVNMLQPAAGKFTSYRHSITEKKSISHNEISDIYEDTKGRLWLASSGGLDLFNKDNSKLVSYTEASGLPASMVQSIQEDRHGTLWLGTSNGLSAFSPATEKFRNFTVEDGLQGQEFKNECSYKSSDGYLFFGGTEGLNYFNPDSIKNNEIIPPVFITGLSVSNKMQHPGAENTVLENIITDTKAITVSYKQNIISFDFAALNYISPGKNQYAYMMEGFDHDWVYCGSVRSATYTNLDPGTYTFKVKASNNDGLWNQTGTSIIVTITPPFWKTIWFIVLLALATAGIIVATFRYRVKTIQQQKLTLEQQVKQQTKELVNLNIEEKNARLEAEASKASAVEANNKLVLKNLEMEQFAYVASHDLKEPLRTITGLINVLQKKYKEKLGDDADKYLNFISDASERMRVLIDDLLEFSRIGTHTKLAAIDTTSLLKTIVQDINATVVESNSVIQLGELPAISGYSTEIKLLFQNLLINAIKFRKKDVPPIIKISGADKGSHWEFAVADNGIGILPQFRDKIFKIFQRLHTRTEYEGSGIGLSHCSKIVAIHGGKIWVDSEYGSGTTFYFTIAKNIS